MIRLPCVGKNCDGITNVCNCRPVCRNRRRERKEAMRKPPDLLERKPLQELIEPQRLKVCENPVDPVMETPFLKWLEVAKKNGAWKQVSSRCPFCSCSPYCICKYDYVLTNESAKQRRDDMCAFDMRVRNLRPRNMY
ncbi:hypothetical protein ACJJTC_011795 [Scirpophaga incertulas]